MKLIAVEVEKKQTITIIQIF